MGCVSSAPSTTANPARTSGTATATRGGQASAADENLLGVKFKAKRGNVFTEGYNASQSEVKLKNIPKTASQEMTIREYIPFSMEIVTFRSYTTNFFHLYSPFNLSFFDRRGSAQPLYFLFPDRA